MYHRKPHNHVTTERYEKSLLASNPNETIRGVSEQLVRKLEELFPPKCKAVDESVESHMLYAGKVELIALLRANLQIEHSVEVFEDTDLDYDAERAT